MMRILLGTVGALALVIAPAAAQLKPLIVRGTIEQVKGPVLTVKSREGETLTVRVASDAKVADVVKASLADIKPGVFVGATAVPQQGGGWKAAEVHLFPNSMRGTGEGDRPYDYKPKSTMTNGTVGTVAGGRSTVGGAVTKTEGTKLTLDYKGGKKTVDVTPETAIVSLVAGSSADLKPGAQIMIPAATRQSDGTLATARIIVGRGIAPPM